MAYATAYGAGNTNGLGTIASAEGAVQQKLYTMDQTGSTSYNGIRFLPLSADFSKHFQSRALATDVLGHRVINLQQWKIDGRVRSYTFCEGTVEEGRKMIQPNDIAVAAKTGRIYLTGGNYGKDTANIGAGDLWMCKSPTPSPFYCSTTDDLKDVKATRLLNGDKEFSLTNGVELSPSETKLYVTESFHNEGRIIRNQILEFDINLSDGKLKGEGRILVDFEELDGSGDVDLDGIRTDMEGNVFAARNGKEGQVIKLSPEGKLLLKILTPGLKEVTNMDLAGEDGKTLYIVGKCIDEPDKGCVDVWYGNSSPGRAWQQLKPQPCKY